MGRGTEAGRGRERGGRGKGGETWGHSRPVIWTEMARAGPGGLQVRAQALSCTGGLKNSPDDGSRGGGQGCRCSAAAVSLKVTEQPLCHSLIPLCHGCSGHLKHRGLEGLGGWGVRGDAPLLRVLTLVALALDPAHHTRLPPAPPPPPPPPPPSPPPLTKRAQPDAGRRGLSPTPSAGCA